MALDPCPPADLLRRSLDHDVSMTDLERHRIEEHVNRCQQGCKQAIHALLRDHTQALLSQRAQASGTELELEMLRASAPRPETYDFLAAAEQPDELGRLGGFRILKVVGVGGMGVVFHAEDPHLERRLAIKAMLPGLAASASARKRFLREARAAAALEHDHIVPILQVGEDRGVPFIAMPFLKGESLSERIQRTPALRRTEVLHIGRETALGLAAAHGVGLIHRDIKPANLWLEASPGLKSGEFRVKILDFGLARAAAADAQITQQGVILGTPAFMSPEQGAGTAVDGRSDLFSLGCVLYRLCTDRLPFQGKDSVATLVAVANDQPPPPAALRPEMGTALSDLVMMLLAKKPEERPATAREVAEALKKLEETPTAALNLARFPPGRQTLPEPAGGPPPRRWRWVVAVTLAAALVAAAIYLFFPSQAAQLIELNNPSRGEFPTLEIGDDRAAAAWVISLGGTVRVNGEERDRHAAADLPKESFRLTWVALRASKSVDNVGLAQLKNLKNLTFLELYECPEVGDSGLAHLEGLTNLKQLILTFTPVSDAALARLKGLHLLTELNLYGTPVGDAGLEHLKDLHLTHLDLSGTKVSDAGLVHLQSQKNLTQLHIRNSRVSDAGMIHLKELKNLAWLSLGNAPVGDVGLAHLKNLGQLTGINLYNTPVSDAGLAALVAMPLRDIDLHRSRVSAQGFKNLHAVFPKATILGEPASALAEDLLAAGAVYVIRAGEGGKERTIPKTADLPPGRFQIRRMDCTAVKIPVPLLTRLSDPREHEFQGLEALTLMGCPVADLAFARSLSSLRELSLAGTLVTDDDLAPLAELRNLHTLDLQGAPISGRGLAHLAGLRTLADLSLAKTKLSGLATPLLGDLKGLQRLSLSGCAIHDDNLEHLGGLVNLQLLDLTRTKVTAAGLAMLRRTLPRCKIVPDGPP